MGKVAVVFAGQGAQYSGMGQGLYEASPAAKAVFDAAEALRPGTKAQCFTGSIEDISLTQNTQPCLFCVGLAAAAALTEQGVQPDMAAGFSLGELPAVVFAGMLPINQGFALVQQRATLMQAAAENTNGGMVAVLKLSNQIVEDLCKKFNHMYPVNYNCPGQLVVAGDKGELEAFCTAVADQKGRAVVLQVSGGFHSPFMETAAEGLGKALKGYDFQAANMPLYANYNAQPYGANAPELLTKQVMHPVRWQETIENMIAAGADTFVELGAGKTLSGLIKKISKDVTVLHIQDQESLAQTIDALRERGKI